jgi:tRNA A-37 threonylcarbamoyl transferase component Bud32
MGQDDGMADLRSSAMSSSSLSTDLVTEAAFQWPGDPLARGGMALIFEGKDRRLGRRVILKTPREGDDLGSDLEAVFRQRVAAEARVLAKLQHPSIVTIYELGKATTGFPFCVLERVEGRSLRDRLDEIAVDEAADGRPHTRARLELLTSLISIAEAMAYAHEHRVVHRDITPNNILLGRRGEATLIDWGIARDLDDGGGIPDDKMPGTTAALGSQTIVAGTPPYVPYEQTQGLPADPRFDVYSLGITLYEVVAGHPPFVWRAEGDPQANERQMAAFVRWLQERGTAPLAMPRDPELSGIIARAIAPMPKDRFTADELVRALKQYLTGDLVFSHRYSPTGRLSRWVRRHRAVTASVAVTLVALIAVGLVWLRLTQQAREKAELQVLAASARLDATDKARAAEQAAREAATANARAEQAQREGKDAQVLRAAADAKREQAERLRVEAEKAEARAKGDASDALRGWQEAHAARQVAESERDLARQAQAGAEGERDLARQAQHGAEQARAAALAAQAAAEGDRDQAKTAQAASEREREAARQAQAAAEADRDSARAGQARAEGERDAARQGQARAESDRDVARAASGSIEAERDQARAAVTDGERKLDQARARIAELEARLRELESARPASP